VRQTVAVAEHETVEVREARTNDFDPWFDLFNAVAAEQKWIGTEGPLERESSREAFDRYVSSEDRTTLLAEAEGRLVGFLGIDVRRGLVEIGMMVDAAWRGRGVGSALLVTCISWASERHCHKIALQVWPHNEAARSLYLKFGFVEEAVLHRHYRRKNGQLWDAIGMGLVLDRESPACPFT
jgi:RimJ/RimL family protein N-acetyltransferase